MWRRITTTANRIVIRESQRQVFSLWCQGVVHEARLTACSYLHLWAALAYTGPASLCGVWNNPMIKINDLPLQIQAYCKTQCMRTHRREWCRGAHVHVRRAQTVFSSVYHISGHVPCSAEWLWIILYTLLLLLWPCSSVKLGEASQAMLVLQICMRLF